MEYPSNYAIHLLEIIRKYSEEEYQSWMNAPQLIAVDHL